uniref:Uncharacterized protein n=1 Tax=viral metagenome TaxID=1070528 RepID=A0A6M3X4X4_9ZZZZ
MENEMPNIEDYWFRYKSACEIEGQRLEYISKPALTQLIAEIISSPVEPGVILQKGDFDEKTKKLIDYLLEKEKEGKICIMTIEGILEANLDDFIKQPTEGLLYDLNRDRVTTLTWIDNNSPKWINDFAVFLVITKLKALLDAIAQTINKRDYA